MVKPLDPAELAQLRAMRALPRGMRTRLKRLQRDKCSGAQR